MTAPPQCPRCAGGLRPPDLWSSAWRCERHGEVHPFHLAAKVGPEGLDHLAARSQVPLWVPSPLLPGWTVTGFGGAGDERTGARATVLACSGPSPLGGPADLLIVAEELGVGLGARYAGLATSDPGPCTDVAPEDKLEAAGHVTGLWPVGSPADRAAFVGEGKGLWLWVVLWPASAALVLLEHVRLADLCDPGPRELVFGAPSPYLKAAPTD